MSLITNYARAYLNWGRWVAECPVQCGSAKTLDPREVMFRCTECLTVVTIDWPDNAQDIWDVLLERPAPKFRNWFPAGHELAIRSGCPHGQTPAELREETREHLHPKDPAPVNVFAKADEAVDFVRDCNAAMRGELRG
jgi:hypothetical protein